MIDNDWTFYTNVNYKDNSNDDPLIKAFNKFIKDLMIDPEEINKEINKGRDMKRIIINTDGKNDIIDIGSDYHFLKSRFLVNKKFKQKLIEYYNPFKIYVRGPINVYDRVSNPSTIWYIDLCKLK